MTKKSASISGGNGDEITVPKNASFTYQDEDGEALTFSVSSSAQAYTIARKADDVYAVEIFGTATVSDSDTTLTFKTSRALSNAVTVYFDDVGNILSVDGLDNLGTKDSMKVDETKTVESADGGLAIGNPDNPTGYISVGTGKFTYKNGVVSVESGDTVYSLNGYALAGTGGTVTDVNGNTYTGKGYFVFDADAGITGFVFISKNDYVQVPTGSNINLYYLTEANPFVPPAITNTEGYTVTLVDNTAANPQFKISDISAGATIPTTAPLGAKLITEDKDDTLTIDLAGNIKAIDKLNSKITLAAGTHDITINGNYLSYTSANKLTAVADGNNLVSVSGLTSSDVINAGTNENIIFQFEVEGNAELNVNGETYTVEGEGKQAVYITGGGEALATVSGIKAAKGVTINPTDKIITVAKSSLDKNTVTVDGDYGLELANNVTKPTTKGAWSINASTSTATYKETTSAGYSVEGNEIIYSPKNTSTLVTVEGVKSVKGLSLNDEIVMVANSSLNKKDVTVSDGYTLTLANDVTTPTSTGAWSLKDSTATYKGSATAGYTLADDGKSITYSKAKSATTLVTVKGVKSVDGLTLKDNVITVANSSLNKGTVTVNDGYTLELADDVTESTTTGDWSFKNSTATYEGSTTAGYRLAEDSQSITYSEEKSGETLATVTGVKSADGLTVNGTTITVSASSLNAKKVTVSDGYTLKLADDVTEPTTKNVSLALKNSTATYTSSTTAGYTLADDGQSINYTKATSGTTLATIKGVKSKSGISLKNDVVTLKNSALKNKVTVSGGLEFNFASDYKNATITGSSSADTITVLGSNIKLNGAAGADTLSGGSSNDSINGGNGNDVIYGNKGADTLVGGSGNDSLWGGAGNDALYGGAGNDTFIYKPGEGTDTIFDYKSGDMLQILKSNGSEGGMFSSSSYQNGNLTLGISGGGSVIFNNVSKSNSFNINGDSYKISGSKLIQK
jgi:Ca2+-binding RTX toxin-like protein